MKQIILRPALHRFETCGQFAEEFQIGKGDLIITNEYIFQPCFGELKLPADVVYQEKYGAGEPSDDMFEAMYADIAKLGRHRRIIGIGGGTVLDLSKLFSLKNIHPVTDLYDRKLEVAKDKELVLVPTTCGTGSEVTNISILAFNGRHSKLGLAADELYATDAVLIPELLRGLPFRFFATSSIDALVHSVESSLSPKATPYTKLFGYKAMEMILKGYQKIARDGEEARFPLLGDFIVASNFAGFAFGTAGCAAVHAMSYPLSGTFHVAHGEANYALFTGVLKNYMEIDPNGKISELNRFLAGLLGCGTERVYDELEKLLGRIIKKRALHEYGATQEMLEEWTGSVLRTQERLMQNNYVPLDAERVLKIYRELF